jgi:hypothetical protein
VTGCRPGALLMIQYNRLYCIIYFSMPKHTEGDINGGMFAAGVHLHSTGIVMYTQLLKKI